MAALRKWTINQALFDPGIRLERRIASGNLLRFNSRDALLTFALISNPSKAQSSASHADADDFLKKIKKKSALALIASIFRVPSRKFRIFFCLFLFFFFSFPFPAIRSTTLSQWNHLRNKKKGQTGGKKKRTKTNRVKEKERKKKR